jgi:hypothetical protein
MPTYTFINSDTGETFTQLMMISEMEDFLQKNPNIKTVPAAPQIVSGVMSGRNKPDNTFRDMLKSIKKNNRGSKINTF